MSKLKRMTARLASLMLSCLVALPAHALEPNERLADPALEARARTLSAELRCLVCQNQSIDDSNAELAKDLRVLVRERLVAGDTNEQVLDFVVARYGDFVLLKPPLNVSTLILWLTPVLTLLAILAYVLPRLRTPSSAGTGQIEALSEAERRRLGELIGTDETASGATKDETSRS